MAMTEFRRVQTHTTYKLTDGTVVPGATTVVGVLAKPALLHWAWKLGSEGVDYRRYRDAAAEVGTLVHYLILCTLKRDAPDLSTFTPEQRTKAMRAFGKFEDWLRRFPPDLSMSYDLETPMVSERWRYGGTIDFYGSIGAEATLVDFKTGGALYDEHLIQLAAYANLLKERDQPLHCVRLLRIGRDDSEGFEERVYRPRDLTPYWRIFKHCLAIWWERKRLKGDVA